MRRGFFFKHGVIVFTLAFVLAQVEGDAQPVQPAEKPSEPQAIEPVYLDMAHPVHTPENVAPLSSLPVLTLEDVWQRIGNAHPKLFSADLERRIAGARLLEKQGAFDPQISLETEYLRYNDFSKPGSTSTTFDNELGLQWLTRSGLRFSTGARYNTGDVKPPLYPTGSTGEYFMGARLPLLRGFRINDKVVQELQAQLGVPQVDARFTQARLGLLVDAANAYWDWVAATRKFKVATGVLNLGTFRLSAVTERANAGDLPQIDAVEAEQEVMRRQGQLAKAERDLERALYKLSYYLWESNGTPSQPPTAEQAPRNIPEPVAYSTDDWMDGRRAALEKRPELRALNLERAIREIDLDYAENLKLPILDLFAQPGMDTGNDAIGPTLKAGVSLVVPLRQRTARGLIAASEFQLQKLDMEQRLLLQEILLSVDDAVSAVNAAYRQYTAAKKEMFLAQALEQGERDRFELGDSTLFLVNQRERATAEAAAKVIELEALYHQAIANFKAVTGQL